MNQFFIEIQKKKKKAVRYPWLTFLLFKSSLLNIEYLCV